MSRPVVLNTRPRELAAELSGRLRASGYTPLEVPAIQTAPAWDAREVADVLARLRADAYAWAVFPSRNAVRFILEGLAAVGGSAADFGHVNILAGTGTADTLLSAGLAPTRDLERFSAEAALSLLRSEIAAGDRVLVSRAAEGRDELVRGLTAVDAPVCYRTQAVPPVALREAADWLAASKVQVVTFASPSAVASLVGGLAALGATLRGVRVVCLGATTAQAARDAGLRVDRVAERTDIEGLVTAVTTALTAAEVPV